MEKIKLKAAVGSQEGPTIFLTAPRQDDEHCSITLEHIGEPPPSLQFIPLSSNPLLTCAEMEVCGHRFNAMALIAHFARNSMTCPMCRAGLANNRMDVCASFPNESWTTAAHLAKLSASADSYGDDEGYFIGGLGDDGISTPPAAFSMLIPVDVREMSTFVVFVMFRTPRRGQDNNNNVVDIDEPCIRLQCPLILNSGSGTYELSATSRRKVSTMINEMRVHSISASIFARHAQLYDHFGSFLPLATMETTRLSNNMTVELVTDFVDSPGAQPPPHLKISVQMPSSNGSNGEDNGAEMMLSEFIFTLPQMVHIRRLLVLGG